MSTPFDNALTARVLREAVEDHALRHGAPGSPSYRAAWLQFRQEIKTIDDLHRWRVSLTATDHQNGSAPNGKVSAKSAPYSSSSRT